ncbi:hypothetical protein EHS25_005594 [Saitozyma podzolica]|uniref:Uncharacterized protein n=1 Tax=Saitozyma podzolica TaxID=1890683 RepID=A0A427XXW9_9TREE|nr:hypothetical protein EHS25_005594 [Saitozyma podzolica]
MTLAPASLPSQVHTPKERDQVREREGCSDEALSVGQGSVVDQVLAVERARAVARHRVAAAAAADSPSPPSYIHLIHLHPYSPVLTARSLLLLDEPTPPDGV